MIGVPIAPRRVFGVALAVGEGAGDDTWVCRAHPGEGGIRLESIEPLAVLPGGASEPEAAYHALVGKVLDAPRSAWGFDFAFGLPVAGSEADEGPSAGRARDGWRAGIARVLDESLERLVAAAGTERRQTDVDRELPGPLAAERRAATHAGMRGVLSRLHGQPGVLVLPIDPLPAIPEGTPPAMIARTPSTYVLEVSPVCTLRDLAARIDEPPAAGAAALPSEPRDREDIVRALMRAEWVRPVPRALRQRAGSDVRALRAVLAAVGVWRGTRTADHGALHHHSRYGLEGHVYC